MVPANHYLILANNFEVFKHLRLVGRVDSLNTDRGLQLRHGEDIDDLNRVLVYELSQQDSHDFEGDA